MDGGLLDFCGSVAAVVNETMYGAKQIDDKVHITYIDLLVKSSPCIFLSVYIM